MQKKVVTALSGLLSGVEEVDEQRVAILGDLLESKTGVGKAHVLERSEEEPQRLCIHFDPRLVSARVVLMHARRAGLTMEQEYGHLELTARPMHERKARRVASELRTMEGVVDAVVSPEGAVRVDYAHASAEPQAIRSRVERLTDIEETAHDHEHGSVFGVSTELLFAAVSALALVLGWLGQKLGFLPPAVALGFTGAAFFFGGAFPLREAFANLRQGRFEIDFLMLVAAAGAAFLGEWTEGALLLVLFSIGHALEGFAMGRAKRAIEALAELAPKVATVRRDGGVEEVPVESLQLGDIVLVKPNERLAADGVVVAGESAVNQAPVTGESVPVDKRPIEDVAGRGAETSDPPPESRVYAGSINGSGALDVRVTRAASDSTLARVVQMVSEAEVNQAPTQAFTDRFERVFVPAVLAGALLSMFAWVVVDETFAASFYRSMALLVAASPCALAIATPSAILSGVARAARGGVLVKGGAPLEQLGRLEAVAFDKTGTLTEGRPRVVDVVPEEGVEEGELLQVAVGVEALSDHPLAAAVVRDGTARLAGQSPAKASNLRSITGRGVQADVGGEPTFVGKDDLFDEVEGEAVPESLKLRIDQLEARGRTTMVVRRGARYLGALGLMDTPRPEAKAVVAELRDIGIQRMLMISGDNQRVAEAVAREVGLDEAHGDLMPDDKVQTVKKLRAKDPVAMVGDGVNDAPAMANATVGIAMGAAGSDVALETADVALMADDLTRLPFAVGLSRATSRVIRQNLWMSLGAVAVLVPATIAGLGIGPAVVVHEGSTLVVVFNALRLLGFRESAPRA